MAVRDIDTEVTSESSLQKLLERLRLRYKRPRYAEYRNLQPAPAITTFNHQESVSPSTISEALIRKPSTKSRRIISSEEIDDCRLKGICVFCKKPEIPEHYHKNARIFLIDSDEDQLSGDKEFIERKVESESFWGNERCDVSGVIAKMDSTDAIETVNTNESIGTKDYTDSIQEIDLHQGVESLEVYSTDLIPEINSHLEVEAASVHQLEEFEKEVSIFSLEPSLRVNQCQSMLLQNSSLQPFVDESRSNQNLGVWFAPKVEEAYILDVEVVDELIQKSVEAVDLVAHQMFDHLLLRGRKMNQRSYQKDWTFKYKLEKRSQHFSDKVFTEKEELQVFVCDNINDGFGWDNFCGFHEELLSVCATDENLVLTKNVGPKTIAEVLSHWTVIPVPSLSQKESKRLRGRAYGFQKSYVGQDKVLNAVSEAILRSGAGLGRLQLTVSLKGCSKKKQMKTFDLRLIHKVKQTRVASFEKEAHQEMVAMMHHQDSEDSQILITGLQKPAMVNTQIVQQSQGQHLNKVEKVQQDWNFHSWRSKFNEKLSCYVLWKILLCKDWMFKFKVKMVEKGRAAMRDEESKGSMPEVGKTVVEIELVTNMFTEATIKEESKAWWSPVSVLFKKRKIPRETIQGKIVICHRRRNQKQPWFLYTLRSWLNALRDNIKAFGRAEADTKSGYSVKVICESTGIESKLITLVDSWKPRRWFPTVGFLCFIEEKFQTMEPVWFWIKHVGQSSSVWHRWKSKSEIWE